MRNALLPLLALGALTLAACGGEPPAPLAPPPPPATPAAPPVAVTAPPPVATPPAAPAPSMFDLQTASLKGFSDALNAHDAKKYAALFAPDGVTKSGGAPDVVGRDAIAASIQQVFTAFPDLKFAFARSWQKGNIAITHWAWNGTDTGGFMGAKPTGRAAGEEGAAVAVYNDDGSVKELRLYSDGGTTMSQLDPKAKKGSFRAPPTLATSTDVVAAKDDDAKALDTANALYQAFETHKIDAVSTFITDATLADDLTAPATMKGVKDWKATLKQYFTAFPDCHQLPFTNQWAIGGYVVSEGVLSGTHKGPIGPIRATGKPVSIHFIDVMQIQDGKVARFWTWSDSIELLTEIGVMKPPAPAGAAGK